MYPSVVRFIFGTLFFCAIGLLTAGAMWIIGKALNATHTDEWFVWMIAEGAALAGCIWLACWVIGRLARSQARGRAQ